MCTIVIEALTPLDRISRIKMYKNNARSRLFCRIAKRSIAFFKVSQEANLTLTTFYLIGSSCDLWATTRFIVGAVTVFSSSLTNYQRY